MRHHGLRQVMQIRIAFLHAPNGNMIIPLATNEVFSLGVCDAGVIGDAGVS